MQSEPLHAEETDVSFGNKVQNSLWHEVKGVRISNFQRTQISNERLCMRTTEHFRRLNEWEISLSYSYLYVYMSLDSCNRTFIFLESSNWIKCQCRTSAAIRFQRYFHQRNPARYFKWPALGNIRILRFRWNTCRNCHRKSTRLNLQEAASKGIRIPAQSEGSEIEMRQERERLDS